MRREVDVSAYLVIGPENTVGRPVAEVATEAVRAGFTCVQVRSKVASARELIACVDAVDAALDAAGMREHTTLLVDDRLDVVLACQAQGTRVDGIHVGQADIPVAVCRQVLGADATIGVTAPADETLAYLRDVGAVDYVGVGPVHATPTKSDCGLTITGEIATLSSRDIIQMTQVSPVPIVVGGGVKLDDLDSLAKTGVAGFFVVSAVCAAPNPYLAAKELVDVWNASKVTI